MSAPITHRRVLAISLPILVSNATVPLLGIVDTGVVGQIGEAAPIGAVAVGAAILATFYWLFGFLRMGTTALVAQAVGAKDRGEETGEISALFTRGLLIAAAGGSLFIAGQSGLFALAFLVTPASDAVEALTRDYLAIRIWGAPATISLYVVTGWLIALERTRAVLLVQLWINGLNVVLDLWFVLGLGWGVEGVALATLIAEWTGLALGLLLCRTVFAGPAWRDWTRVFDPAQIRRMFAINRDILLRNLLLTLCFYGFIALSSGLGDVPLAANQVLMQFFSFTSYALDGFAFAAETLVGQAVGKAARSEVQRATRLACLWGGLGALILSLGFWLLGPMIIDIMTTSEPVRAEARLYLLWLVLAPLFSAASFLLDGVYFGATWTRDLVRAMLQSVLIYVIAVAILLPLFGNHGLWAALMVLSVARAVTLWSRYPRLLARVGSPT